MRITMPPPCNCGWAPRLSQHDAFTPKAEVPSPSQERLANEVIQVGMKIQKDCQGSMVARLLAQNATLRKENARLKQQLEGSVPGSTGKIHKGSFTASIVQRTL